MKLINKYIDGFIHEFGFLNTFEFFDSTFGYAAQKPSILVGLSFGAIGYCLQMFVGLDPLVYLSFVLLLILEFFTGIRASLKEGKKIYSKRFGRVILKIMTYTLIIGAINIFKNRLDVPVFFNFEVNIYSMIYYAALNLIVIQLILSVFENLSRLGYEESSKIYGVIAKILHRYIKLITPEEQRSQEEKEENNP